MNEQDKKLVDQFEQMDKEEQQKVPSHLLVKIGYIKKELRDKQSQENK